MPVEFLTDDEAAAYGRYAGAPSQDLERVFILDDEDRALVDRRRGEHMKLGLALQLVIVRWLGTFLEDPLEVPGAVLDFVAGQLGVGDPSQVSGTPSGGRRGSTRYELSCSGPEVVPGAYLRFAAPGWSGCTGAKRRDGTAVADGRKMFVLRYLQARDPDLTGTPFFAAFSADAAWLTDLKPAPGTRFPGGSGTAQTG